jgi:hypothetical protein
VSTDPGDVARRWLAASNSGDVEAMIDLYSEDAVHESPKVRRSLPGSDGKLVGKAAIRTWWEQSIGGVPGLSYELSALTSDGSRAVIEYLRRAPGEEPVAVAEVFEVRDGKIVHSIVYHF